MIWLILSGAIWVSEFGGKLLQRGQEIFASMTAPDYDTICLKLRRQRASGGPVDLVPAIPALELAVYDGVGKAVAAPGRCLVEFAIEEGVALVPVVFKVVSGDGSVLREIEDRSGKRTPMSDLRRVSRPQPLISDPDYRAMVGSLVFILAVPTVLLTAGMGLWWVAAGFRPNLPDRP